MQTRGVARQRAPGGGRVPVPRDRRHRGSIRRPSGYPRRRPVRDGRQGGDGALRGGGDADGGEGVRRRSRAFAGRRQGAGRRRPGRSGRCARRVRRSPGFEPSDDRGPSPVGPGGPPRGARHRPRRGRRRHPERFGRRFERRQISRAGGRYRVRVSAEGCGRRERARRRVRARQD